jgi:hypothetical protein
MALRDHLAKIDEKVAKEMKEEVLYVYSGG